MILKIVAIGFITLITAILVRNERQDIAILIGIVGGVAILLSVLDGFTDVIKVFYDIASVTGVNNEMIKYLLKIIGAGYVIEFACDTAEEAKMPSLAGKISFGGKVVIFCLMIPVIKELLDVVISLLSFV
ncbi:MAG: hypothetical protein IKM44_00780 [Clostridia bacterium]|nr:hypothetical protein [Clostridia bacterium]